MKNSPRELKPDWYVLPSRSLFLSVQIKKLSVTYHLFTVESIGHEVRRDLRGEGNHSGVKETASNQLPLQGGLHRACDLQSHHGVTATSCLPSHSPAALTD